MLDGLWPKSLAQNEALGASKRMVYAFAGRVVNFTPIPSGSLHMILPVVLTGSSCPGGENIMPRGSPGKQGAEVTIKTPLVLMFLMKSVKTPCVVVQVTRTKHGFRGCFLRSACPPVTLDSSDCWPEFVMGCRGTPKKVKSQIYYAVAGHKQNAVGTADKRKPRTEQTTSPY